MKTFLILSVACCSILFNSCNTFIGLGRDMRIAGEAMEKSGNKGSGGEQSGAPIY